METSLEKTQSFPIFKTKIKGLKRRFNLSDPKGRAEYFEAKAGLEIKKLRDYLRKGNTFIAYLLGKKNSGKGTYAKLFIEAIGTYVSNKKSPMLSVRDGEAAVAHLSVGDIIRQVHQEVSDEKKKKELKNFLGQNYRGYISLDEAFRALLSRDTKTLLPTEFILALIKREISRLKRKALFIDGFPRNLDQVSYSLFFRDLIDYREDPDIFVLIDVPEAVLNERIKYRRVCPKCQTPRNLKLLSTPEVGYDKKTKEFYLICDNPNCRRARMVAKEGDSLGTGQIRERLLLDEELIKKAFSLYGVPKIFLRNSVPKALAKYYVDDYELTPEYCCEWNAGAKKVKVSEKPWLILDGQGSPSYSLLAPPVAVSLIKQMADVLGL